MIRCLALAFTAIFKSKALLAAENLCLRQQLLVLKRRQVRPQIRDVDRRFWLLACRWFSEWSCCLIIVKPDTVIRWHRKGWKAYWRWRSSRSARIGRKTTDREIRELIRRIACENPLWGQRRIQAELARLGITVCARTVAKYMRRQFDGTPSPGWRQFLAEYSQEIWGCDLFTVQTIWFRTLYVFFVIHHGTRELIHARVTAHPNSHWLAQQMVEACGPGSLRRELTILSQLFEVSRKEWGIYVHNPVRDSISHGFSTKLIPQIQQSKVTLQTRDPYYVDKCRVESGC